MRGQNKNLFTLWPRVLAMVAMALGFGMGEAAEVELEVGPGITASAEYHSGDAGKPALLIVHGFLQTREFHTVARQVEALTIAGYPVLAPTLSLNVPNRANSLPCEAVHTHSMDQSLDEISAWVEWLGRRGHEKIVLIGHSYGAVQAVAYLATQRPQRVTRLIAVSLVDVEHGVGESVKVDQRRAAMDAEAAPDALRAYTLHYCLNETYVTTARAYHSYVRWSRTAILDALRALSVPVTAVKGSADHRMGTNWAHMVADAGAKVVVVDGANHFFDARHEAPLHDILESLLAQETPAGEE